jgi:DNA polymerase-3 subunit gamma/tau
VIIAGLQITPVRDRYKIFIIDEVHQLSTPSFNALLKSIEEPPAHVVFMMATTELHKIPDTILSRSQVFEFRTISSKAIVEQLRRIASAEKIEVSDSALVLIARAAEGSMRDAQSALDQVMAFAGSTIGVDDVSTVLGLVGRDLLLDIVEAVLDEDGPRAFTLADRATEAGHDLRLVLRELTRVVRDMMILSVDPARAGDGELGEGELERLTTLSRRCSREDLMRAFDVLSKAEQDIRVASHPRYHFEMVLLRWMHLLKLVPLVDLLEGGSAPAPSRGHSHRHARALPRRHVSARPHRRARRLRTASVSEPARARSAPAPTSNSLAPTSDTLAPTRNVVAPTSALKDAVAGGDQVREEHPVLPGRGAGAAHRRHRRSHHVHICFEPERGAHAARTESRVARISGRAAVRETDAGDRRAVRYGERARSERRASESGPEARSQRGGTGLVRGAGDARRVRRVRQNS